MGVTHFEEVEFLKWLLKRVHNTLESIEDKASLLKDEVVVTYVHHFERATRHALFFHPDLDLSLMDPFQVVRHI